MGNRQGQTPELISQAVSAAIQARMPQAQDFDPITQELNDVIARRMAGEEGAEASATSTDPIAFNAMTTHTQLGTQPDASQNMLGDLATLANFSAGFVAPIMEAGASIIRLPGDIAEGITQRDLSNSAFGDIDAAADFLDRAQQGLVTNAEQSALIAGLSPEAVATTKVIGELVGFVIPTVAAIKGARLMTGLRGTEGFVRNVLVDTVGGSIYGFAMKPAEGIADRFNHAGREAMLFGLPSVGLNGVIFGFGAMGLSRSRRWFQTEELHTKMERVSRGERVIFAPDEAVPLVQLMNEQGFLANSPEAAIMLSNFDLDNALLAAIKGTAEGGQTRGFVQNVGDTFAQAAATVDRYRPQFPGLKFDILRGEAGFNIHFGMKGFTNSQRAQVARTGRFSGQTIEKNGATYEYVRPGAAGRLVVKTSDGKVTSLAEAGVTDTFHGVEPIELPTAGRAMYEDFKTYVMSKWDEAAGAEVGMFSEEELISLIRNGEMSLDDATTRIFEVSGLTHPSEAGIVVEGQAAAWAEEVLRSGRAKASLLEATPIRDLDAAFDNWLALRSLDANAIDIDAFRANFKERLKQDMWAMVPDDELNLLRDLREEIIKTTDELGIPIAAQAHIKGFHYDVLPDGTVDLRDINTGAKLSFADEGTAALGMESIVRSEKDPLALYVSSGEHGLPGLTGGFDPSDGVWTSDVNIGADEFRNVAMPVKALTNTRDWLGAYEAQSGMPVLTKFFEPLDSHLLKMDDRLIPFAREIGRIWKGIPQRRRRAIAEFWRSAENTDLKGQALTRAAQRAGLKPREISAMVRSKTLMDVGAQEAGLEGSRYIQNYYPRIQPANAAAEKAGQALPDVATLIRDDQMAMREFTFFADMPRTGEMNMVELDPEIVMHKYFKDLMFKQEVWPQWQRALGVLNTRIKDLPGANQTAVMRNALPGTTPESFVLPKEIRDVLNSVLNNIRGAPNASMLSAGRKTAWIAKKLGITTDEKLFQEVHSIYLTSQYGAALAGRANAMNRNAIQPMYMQYPRVGGKHATPALQRTLTQEGFDHAVRAGWVRPVEASLPYGDALFGSWITNPAMLKGNNPLSIALATAIRAGLRTGRVSTAFARKLLVPYGSSDMVNRAWVGHWEYQHVGEVLDQFYAKKIDWDGFVEAGLPFYSTGIKREFQRKLHRLGREDALNWIGKQATDEANFLFGAMSTPEWMQTWWGRPVGVFGQWPMWATEMYLRRQKYATTGQQAKFFARTLIMTGVFANMTLQTGIDMWSWVAPSSLLFGGGPGTDVIESFRGVMTAPLDQKAGNAAQVAKDVTSLVLPGQIFFKEMTDALNQNDPSQAAAILFLGKPIDQDHYAIENIYNNPNAGPAVRPPQALPQGFPTLDQAVRDTSRVRGSGGR